MLLKRGVSEVLVLVASAFALFLCLNAVLLPDSADARGKQGSGSFFMAASADGAQVLFSTAHSLDPADRDEYPDVYESRAGKVRLVSITPDGRWDKGVINPLWSSETEARSIFLSRTSYSAVDRDSEFDLYEVAGDKVRLISPEFAFTGDCTARRCDFWWEGTAPDGSTIYLGSYESLTSEDTDSHRDLYSLSNGALKLLSGGPLAGGGDSQPVESRGDFAPDGSRVYFQTKEPLVAQDTDDLNDLYMHTASGTELVSDWESNDPEILISDIYVSKKVPGRFFFGAPNTFGEVPEDTGFYKLHMSDGGLPTMIAASSSGSPAVTGESADGETVFFATGQQLTEEDKDLETYDLYTWQNGEIDLFSVGPRGSQGSGGTSFLENRLLGTSPDGGFYFATSDQLVGADDDVATDLYLKHGEDVDLISVGEDGRNQPEPMINAKILDDGARILMVTSARWTSEDRDQGGNDLYIRQGDSVRLVTGSPINEFSRHRSPGISVRSVRGDRYIYSTALRLLPHDSDNQTDVYSTDLSAGNSTRLLSEGDLRITSGPLGTTEAGPASFRFNLRGKKPGFACSIDELKPSPCKSPATYRNLEPGRHLFRVHSTGKNGLGKWVTAERYFTLQRESRPERPPGVDLISVSSSGRRAVLETSASLTRSDRDEERDIFAVSASGKTRLVSSGSELGARTVDVSTDGNRVTYRTSNSLTAADDDFQSDLYQWTGKKTTLFPSGINLIDKPLFAGASNGGRTYPFATREQLTPADTDQATDVYVSSPDGIRLMTPGGDTGSDTIPVDMSADGSTVLFRTFEQLAPADTDEKLGLYWSDGSQIRMVTAGGIFQSSYGYASDPRVVGISRTGSIVTLVTALPLVPEDLDQQNDVYRWTATGGPSLLSESLSPDTEEPNAGVPEIESGSEHAYGEVYPYDYDQPYAITPDGQSVVISTEEKLLSEDRDNRNDIYVSHSGDLELVGLGKGDSSMRFRGASKDLKTVVVETSGTLVTTDRDNRNDIYVISGRKTTRIAPTGKGASRTKLYVTWVSHDGKQVLFTRHLQGYRSGGGRRLHDLYLWKAGRLERISNWTRGRDRYIGDVQVGRDGKTVWFETAGGLIKSDRDNARDVYRLSPKGLLKVS